ncbi:MAG TPA: hypothetical protein DCK95_05895 [Anaerolineaceae bacterium]|uniref:Metallophosphoesterase n=1 Tax=Anaerolinea thermophila TaxID=167964 RepID=A0A101FYS7_9CHLR|nr:MAG: Metallophosphoesterase [Anaerolinea thermophila]HAF61840.1 hypothetical protein [Anaerolineaceae bacterium]
MEPFENLIAPFHCIALVSDIHGNLPALQNVHQHALQQGAQLFFNAGDTVGYGPFPNECIDFIRDNKFFSVIGDYDQKVLAFPQHSQEYLIKKHPLKYLAFQWAYEHLTQTNIDYLSHLPVTHQMTVGQKSIFLTHGSPTDIKAHLGAETSPQEWQQYQQETPSDLIITGNTHVFHQQIAANTLFVNPGSVGRQDDGDPRASYALLTLDDPITVSHFRIEYNMTNVSQALELYNLPQEFMSMFQNGLSLDGVLKK